MRYVHLGIALLAGALSGSACRVAAEDAPAGHTAWTSGDLAKVSEAAQSAAMGYSGSTRIFELIKLHDALVASGDKQQAHAVLDRAASLLDGSESFMDASAQGDVIERLAAQGNEDKARSYVGSGSKPRQKNILLGRLAAGLGQASDVAGAMAIAQEIEQTRDDESSNQIPLVEKRGAILGRLARSLLAAGALDQAFSLAEKLGDNDAMSSRPAILSELAHTYCRPGNGRSPDPAKGRKVVNRAIELARTAGPSIPGYQKAALFQAAVFGEAECGSPSAARALAETSGQAANVLAGAAKALADRQELDAAKAVAPALSGTDPNGLLADAKSALTLGEHDLAVKLATEASRQALAHQTAAAPGRRYEELQPIFSLLTQLGAYDQAIATVQPIELVNRKQYYTFVLREEISHKDQTAIAKTVPLAVAAFREPVPSGVNSAPGLLYELTRLLAVSGYLPEARLAEKEFLKQQQDAGTTAIKPWQLAVLKADFGDLPGALVDAQASGPITQKPGPGQIVMATIMQFASASKPPTKEEVEEAMKRSQAALPPLVPGPYADALCEIVRDLAAQGKLDQAQEVEQRLEGVDAADPARADALVTIANAQLTANNPRAALEEVLRLHDFRPGLEILLKLAARPPTRGTP